MSASKEQQPKSRWNTYQQERFPLLRHGLLVAITTTCVLAFVAHAQGLQPQWWALLPATIIGVLAFFQLRVLDEFKDADIDAKYRPERPVPRGLVKLSELRNLGLAAAVIQGVLLLWLRPVGLPVLLAVWVFMALMTTEFFAPQFLKDRPALYLLSHQPIVPLLQVLASVWVWAGVLPLSALAWLAVVSFGAGITLEIGRKLRAPEQEREGVEMYTAAWGIPNALLAWLGGVMLAGLGAFLASSNAWKIVPLLGCMAALYFANQFYRHPTPKGAERLENLSALVVLADYLTLALGYGGQP